MTMRRARLSIVALFVVGSMGLWLLYVNSRPVAEEAAEPPPAAPTATLERGAALYLQQCAICHMADGYGVPNLNAPIVDSPYLEGSLENLLGALVGGSEYLQTQERPEFYANPMPGFPQLSDADLASLILYLRQTYGKASLPPVSVEEVAAARSRLAVGASPTP